MLVGWTAEQFGKSHEGYIGAVLPDGAEPQAVYLDMGSGTYMPTTKEWWAYDGKFGRPAASGYRAACACGWRGPSRPFPAGPDEEDDEELVELAYPDWSAHIESVERRTVPLPPALAEAVERLARELARTAEEAPVAALGAVHEVEATLRRVAAEAARAVKEDELSWEAVATALGITPSAARSRLTGYLLHDLD